MTNRDLFLQEFRTEVAAAVQIALKEDRRRRNWQHGWIAFACIMALGAFVSVGMKHEAQTPTSMRVRLLDENNTPTHTCLQGGREFHC